MKKTVIALMITTSFSLAMAEESNWVETQAGSHIFIKKNDVTVDKENPSIRTTTIAVNIPSMQDRRANPTKTALTNPYPISYVTQLIINCKNKTLKIGSQKVHEKFFGQGDVLEQAEPDPLADFTPLDGIDAMKIWEVTCKSE